MPAMNLAYRKGFLYKCASLGVPEDVALSMLKRAESDPNLARASELFKDYLTVRKHTVGPGEVLSGIARKYRVPLDALMKENGMNSLFVRQGQVLRIPNDQGSGKQERRHG